MPDRSGDPWAMFLYLLGAVTGGLGGCSVAAVFYIRGVPLRPQLILAYSMVGFYFGLVWLVAVISMYSVPPTLENILIHGGVSGAAAAFVLSSGNITIKFVSRKFFGKEFVLVMKDAEKEEKANDR